MNNGIQIEVTDIRDRWEQSISVENPEQRLDALSSVVGDLILLHEEQDTLRRTIDSEKVTFDFECGCFTIYWAEGNRLKGGLACCKKHEAAYQKIENIVPLVLRQVTSKYNP